MLPGDMMTLLLSVHRYQFMSVVKDRSAFSEDVLIVLLRPGSASCCSRRLVLTSRAHARRPANILLCMVVGHALATS